MPDPQELEALAAELRALLAKATKGPWQVSGVRLTYAPRIGRDCRLLQVGPDGDVLATVYFDMRTGRGQADAALIVAAVNALPTLLNALSGIRHEG